ncbi:hypothetical protein P4048_17075 [Pseudomonas aeruginosa]|nr:hypothetical protein [Pseudomonas aeruginosa]
MKSNTSKTLQRVYKLGRGRANFQNGRIEVSEQLLDPIWKELQELSAKITDKRNLEEKILDSCPAYPKSKIATLARKACSSKTEEEASNRSFLSLKYRVFESCEDYFFDNNKFSDTVNQTSIDTTIKSLQQKAADTIKELKRITHTQYQTKKPSTE